MVMGTNRIIDWVCFKRGRGERAVASHSAVKVCFQANKANTTNTVLATDTLPQVLLLSRDMNPFISVLGIYN